MEAILLREPRHFEQIQIPEPERPGPGEALVQVHRVGICGTDISGYLGKMPFYSYPRIPGHELGVEVIEVGPDVSNVKAGDRCSVEPYLNCRHCYACRRGHSNCCETLQVLGVHTDGGLRPRFVVPARKLHESTRLTLEQLALVETLGIGCHAVSRGRPEAGDHVLVIGAGPIGLSVIEFLKLAGVTITVMDVNARRLGFCTEIMQVPHAVAFQGDGSELPRMREVTDGALFPLVFDATGNTTSMCNACNYVAHTGKLVLVGVVTDSVSFPDPLLHRKEMSVLASRNALPADFTRIIGLIEGGQLDTRPWITHRSRFPDLIGDFPSYTRPDTGVIKAMVEVS
jgi:2-desacetyl-2-hydroxyethyl bacteriochlorophyllide A dehydrogenase